MQSGETFAVELKTFHGVTRALLSEVLQFTTATSFPQESPTVTRPQEAEGDLLFKILWL